MKEDIAQHVETLSEPQTAVLNARTSLILDMAGQGAGKTENIGYSSAEMIINFPKIKGFIAANTYMQLNQSTLNKCFATWERVHGLTEYDKVTNPLGHYVLDKQPPSHFVRYEKLKSYNSTISFRNGAMIFVGSLDNFKAHDGKEFGWAHLDETKDTKKEALTTVILARLRQFGLWVQKDNSVVFDDKCTLDQAAANGWYSWNPCYVHTSPAEGGVDWIIDMFNLGIHEEVIRKTLADPHDFYYSISKQQTIVIYQSYWNEANLPPNYIESRKSQLSENEILKFIEGYPFSKTGGEYFPNFSRRNQVTKLKYTAGNTVHLTYDFNVMPYITQLASEVEYVTRWYNETTKVKTNFPAFGSEEIQVMQIRVFKEYCMKSPLNTTEDACEAFIRDFEDADIDVMLYGDSSGRNRITGLGALTQYKIIEGKLRQYLPSNAMKVPLANVARLKRRDLMNRIIEGKIKEVELLIDEDCVETIRDMEFVKMDVDGKFKETVKDKDTGTRYEKIGHTSDALEYLVCSLCKHYLKDF